jgi:hypothetical protein
MRINNNSIILLLSLIIILISCQNDKQEYLEISIKKIYVSCNDSLCSKSHVIISLISHYEEDTLDILMSTFFKRRGFKFFTLLDRDTVNIGFAGDISAFPPNWTSVDLMYMEYRLKEFDYRKTREISLSDSILTRKNVSKIINSPIYYYVEEKGLTKSNKLVELKITRSDTLQIIFQDEAEYKYIDAYTM